jgi:outer membrane receptor protein involved in Fe transport
VSQARIVGFELTTINSYTAKNFTFNFSGGLTYIKPTNLKPVADSQQLDLSYFNISKFTFAEYEKLILDANSKEDNPKLLKYRQPVLVRLSTGANYKRFGVAANYRYRSYMKTIDQYLHLVIGDLNDFRTRYNKGDHVFDLILSYDINDNNQLSLTLDNLTNLEYFSIPGTLAEQRKFTLQYKVTF